MKIRHKINHGWAPDRTNPEWAERVEREAEAATDRAEQRVTKARERLERATHRAESEERRKRPDHKRIKRLWHAVEGRRQELLEAQRIAQASPAGSQHRGRGSYRGVNTGEAL